MYAQVSKRRLMKGIAGLTAVAFLFSLGMPSFALARRSGSGGGEHSEIDYGQVGISLGISIGGMAVGSLLSSGLQGLGQSAGIVSSAPTVGQAFSTAFSTSTMVSGFGAYVAGTQVSRAISYAGSYFDWGNTTTYLAASAGSGFAGGLINPGAALGSSMSRTASASALSSIARGAFVGTMGGLASGATIVAIDGDKIAQGKDPGWGAQLAGMGAGMAATALSRSLIDPETYTTSMKKTTTSELNNNPENQKVANSVKDQLMDQNSRLLGDNADKWDYQQTAKLMDKATSIGYLSENTAVGTSSDGTSRISKGEMFLVGSGKDAVVITLDPQASSQLLNTRIAPDGSAWQRTSGTSFGKVMGKIILSPVIDPLNQWSVFAAKALAVIATEDMHEDEWKTFTQQVAQSTMTTMFDSTATVFKLKPSLWKGVDEAMGDYPALRYGRMQLMMEGVANGVAKDSNSMNLDNSKLADTLAKTNLSEAEKLKFMNDILEQNASLNNLSDQEKLGLFGVLGKQYGMNSAKFNPKNTMYNYAMDIYRNKRSGTDFSDTAILGGTGVSHLGILGRQLYNNLRYDLPVNTASGLLTVGLKQTLKDPKNQNDVFDNMLVTFGESVGTSLVRGAVWYAYSKHAYDKTLDSIINNKFSPEVAAHRNLQSPADIVLARANGYIPMADTQAYTIEESKTEYRMGGDNLDPKLAWDSAKSKINSNLEGMNLAPLGSEGWVEANKYINEMKQQQLAQETATLMQEYSPALVVEGKIDPGKLDADGRAVYDKALQQAQQNLAARWEGVDNVVGSLKSDNLRELVKIRPVTAGELDALKVKGQVFYKSSDTTMRAGTDLVFRDLDGTAKVASPSGRVEWFEVNNEGKLSPADEYYDEGRLISPSIVARPATFLNTLAGSLGQGLYEYGSQSLGMGAPAIKQGQQVSTYTWYKYAYDLTNPSSLRTLTLLSSYKGYFGRAFLGFATDTGREVAERVVMTTMADVPGVKQALGLSSFITISDYKGKPFGLTVVIPSAFGGGDTRFFDLPANYLTTISVNPMHTAFRRGILSQTTARDILSAEGNEIRLRMNGSNVQTGNTGH